MSSRKITVPTDNTALAEHVTAIRKLGKQTVENVIEIGRLIECKRIRKYGNWLPWLEQEFGWTDDTALNFMRIHELSKSRNFRDLRLPVSALYLLAAPSTPTEARDEIIERAQAGETVPVAEAKRIIEDTKKREQSSKTRRRRRRRGARASRRRSRKPVQPTTSQSLVMTLVRTARPKPSGCVFVSKNCKLRNFDLKSRSPGSRARSRNCAGSWQGPAALCRSPSFKQRSRNTRKRSRPNAASSPTGIASSPGWRMRSQICERELPRRPPPTGSTFPNTGGGARHDRCVL
jgi:hypothetical protein